MAYSAASMSVQGSHFPHGYRKVDRCSGEHPPTVREHAETNLGCSVMGLPSHPLSTHGSCHSVPTRNSRRVTEGYSASCQRALKVPPVSHIEPHAVLPHWNQEYGGTFSGLEPYHFFTVMGKFPVTLMVALASGPSPEQADHSSGRE